MFKYYSVLLLLLSFNPLSAETIVIAHAKGEYFPFEYNEAGEFKGLHADLIIAGAQHLKVKVEFRMMPWRRAIKALQQGRIDALSYLGDNPQRRQFALFEHGNILSSTQSWPIILASRRAEIRFDGSLESLSHQRIAVGAGFKYGEPFDSADYLIKVPVVAPNPTRLTGLLVSNRVDVILSSKEALLRVYGLGDIKQRFHIFPRSVAVVYSYLAFAKVKKHQALARRFAAALTLVKESEYYRQRQAYYQGLKGISANDKRL